MDVQAVMTVLLIAFFILSFALVFFCLFIGIPYAERRRRYHEEKMREITEGLKSLGRSPECTGHD